ncbi:hypothetical protein WICPIJ_008676 [Wickerhamomyces pijperi]|uniref:Sec20 C-terminal domain-containing protein n=1 Tax=Wickerhamomyces pijperi TaxID=599730 RepID=A0A9P8PW21_WICPI|nr:hypothetical protein WICPIJ_008676 [Wickerhamomyces pijperi]
MDLRTEFSQLQQLQSSLLTAFHSISPSHSNESNRLSIINVTYKYQEILNFIKAELEFLYNYPLELEISEGIEDIFQYDRALEFLVNFKRNFSELQFKLRDGIKQSFQQSKESKYRIKHSKKDDEHLASVIKLEDLSSSKSINDKLLSTNKSITSKLQQSSTVLQSTLLQSQLNLDDLTTQDQTLSELSDKYTSLKGVLNKSDEFVKNIRLSNKRDKQWMYYSLIFFALCCAKVIWSRLLKFPYRICKYFLWLVFWSVGLVKRGSANDMVVISSSIVADTTSLATSTDSGNEYSMESVISTATKQTHHPVIEQIRPDPESKQEEVQVPQGSTANSEYDANFVETTTDSYEEQLSRIIDEL